MKNEMVEVLNLLTGQRGKIRRRLFESPIFNDGILEEVDPSQKPYVPELFKPRKEEELNEAVEVEEEDE